MKIRLVGYDLFHVDVRVGRQTGRYDEANSRFLPFCPSDKVNTCTRM